MRSTRMLQDADFPGLTLALDPERVRAVLSERLPECRRGVALERVTILQVQYQPGTRCAVQYALKLREDDDRRSRTQWLTAMLLREGGAPPAPDRRLEERYRASEDRPLRTPILHLADEHLVFHAFPYDPALPSLVDACDPEHLRMKLGRRWKNRGVRPREVVISPLGYTPGARAALGVDVLSEARGSGLPEVRRLVAKLDGQRHASEIFARSWAVWKEARRRLFLAPPVGHLSAPDLSLQERLEGVRLSDLAGTGEFIGPVRQLARGIAVLHDMKLPLPSRRASLQSVRAARRWAAVLADLRPRERRRILGLRDRLVAVLEARARITGPIHGDLHPSNLLVHQGRVALIDLDNMVLGDRLLDVGRFLSALRTSALRVAGTHDGLGEAAEAFLEQYLSHTGEDERRARLFESAALLTSATTGFRLQRDGWDETAGVLIDECERTLALSGAGSAGAGAGPAAGRRASRETRRVDRLVWAMDELYVGSLLEPHVRRIYGAELGACRVERRADTGRHHRLRYALSGWLGGERWRVVLDAFLGRDRSGRREWERLEVLRRALDDREEAPLMPRPVALLRELGLQVFDSHGGQPLLEALRSERREPGRREENGGVIARVGRALATLHATPVALGKELAPERELGELRSVEARLSAIHRPAGTLAAEVTESLEAAMGGNGRRRSPVLRGLSPRKVRIVGHRVALADVTDVVCGSPLLEAGEMLAELAAELPPGTEGDRSLGGFRAAYLGGRADLSPRLAAFEAAALLRRALRALESRKSELGERLLAAAAHRLETFTAEVCR